MEKKYNARFEILCKRWVDGSGFQSNTTMEQDLCMIDDWDMDALRDYIMDGLDIESGEYLNGYDELFELKVWNGTDWDDDSEPVSVVELWYNEVLYECKLDLEKEV